MVTKVAQLNSYSDLPLVVHPSGLLSGTKADKGWSTRQEGVVVDSCGCCFGLSQSRLSFWTRFSKASSLVLRIISLFYSSAQPFFFS